MFTTDINIKRKLPVINGFVSIPDGQQFLRTKLTALDVLTLVPGSTLVYMGGRHASNMQEIVVTDPTAISISGLSKKQARLWVELPSYDRYDGPAQDWFELLRDAASL